MDYEKKYKEAQERAKRFMSIRGVSPEEDPFVVAKELCEEIFPELAESEDERIRKFLKDYAIEMIAGLESDISISVYDGVKGHDPDAEEELEKWRGARAWLEKQKEQKPAEWSEEDEEIKLSILNILTALRNSYGVNSSAYTEEIDWLKSLRPSWKPNEEQIEAFRGYIEDFRARAEAAVGGWNNFDVMIRLFEQLKKLM